jgi:hypothetical protein
VATGPAPPNADRVSFPTAWHRSPMRAPSHLHPGSQQRHRRSPCPREPVLCGAHGPRPRVCFSIRDRQEPSHIVSVHVPCFTSFGVNSRSRPTAAHSGLLQLGDREFHSHRPSFPPLVRSFLACVKSENASTQAKALRPPTLRGVPIMIGVCRLQTKDLRSGSGATRQQGSVSLGIEG